MDHEPGMFLKRGRSALKDRLTQAEEIRSGGFDPDRFMARYTHAAQMQSLPPGAYGSWMEDDNLGWVAVATAAAPAIMEAAKGFDDDDDDDDDDGYQEAYEVEMDRQAREARRARMKAKREQSRIKTRQAQRRKQRQAKKRGRGGATEGLVPLAIGGALAYLLLV